MERERILRSLELVVRWEEDSAVWVARVSTAVEAFGLLATHGDTPEAAVGELRSLLELILFELTSDELEAFTKLFPKSL